MRFTHLMLAAWCVAVLCICLCDMGGATAQLEGQEQPAIKTAYAQATYGGTCPSDLLSVIFSASTASCLVYTGQTAPGSEFSSWSRCFSSPDGLTLSDGSTVNAICARAHCDTTALTYSLEIKNGHQNAPCPAGSKVALSPYSSLFTSGSITCHSYNDVCGTGPTPTTTPTNTPTPTTTPVTGGTCPNDLLSVIFGASTASCLYDNGQVAPGSEFSSWSRCFSSSDGLTLSDGSRVTAICAHVHCDTTALTYSLEIKNGHQNAPCPAGSTVALSPYSSLFTSGSITCHSYNDVCGTGPNPKDAALSGVTYGIHAAITLLGLLFIVMYALA